MKTLVVLLLCSFTASVYSANLIGEWCTNDDDCVTIVNSGCIDDSGLKCKCDSGHKPNNASAGCVPKTVEDSCSDTNDCQYIANSVCTGTCTCTAGHEADPGDSSCTVVALGGSCTTHDDCRNLVNSECVGTPLICTCKSGYSDDSGSCISNKIGSSCASDIDCSTITNAHCDIDDTNQCVCNAGHTGEVGDSNCSPIALNDACTENGNDCVSIANAECRNEDGLKCLCLTGYYASGQTCMITDCNTPAVTEGYRLGTLPLTTYQSQVPVYCATGYEGVPEPSAILCQANGTWTTMSGCDKVECGSPSVSPPYTVNTPSSTNFQSTATLTCTTGYEGMPAAITCQANMTWTDPAGCTIVDCGNPTTAGYIFSNISNTEYLSNVTVLGCATGYEVTPDQSSLTCQDSGFWDTVTGCTIKECPTLDPFANGSLSTTTHTYETVVTITCYSTHKLSGVSTLTCQSEENWSPPPPTCIEKTVPVFTAPVTSANTASVAENAAVDTSVFTVDATDTDGDNLTFTLLSQAPGTNFKLDGSALRVSAGSTLDFESGTTTYTITFQVSDEENDVASVSLTVTVTDVNETPEFNESTKNVKIQSDVFPPVVVTIMGATDIDADPTLTYAISDGDTNSDFLINGTTGEITTVNPIPYTETPFNLIITATDSGSLVTTGTVEVSMVSAPVLTVPNAVNGSVEYLNENENTGVIIDSLASTDEDGDSPTYTIKSQTEIGAFAISGLNLVTGMSFDYEAGPTTHEVVIGVTDNSSLMLSSTGTLTVNIVDVAEPPVFNLTSYNSRIKEKSGAQASFLQVTATDPDQGDNIIYSITGSNLFDIDQSSGWISTNDNLVYATASAYSLTVTVTDSTTLSTNASVDITVIPESVPQISRPVSGVDTIYISEDTAIGTPIYYNVSATDDDGDPLTYSLTSGSPDFSLDSRSVKVAQELDFDAGVNVYEVKVEVSDQNSVPATATAIITVNLTDINDNAPVFGGMPYTVDIVERMASMQIIQVEATDADSSLNNYNVIQFSIQGGNTGSFSIDSTTGWISADNLDFGTASSHTLAILAKDLNGETGAQETTVNVSVNVITAPVLTMPDAAGGSSHSLDETTNTGETVVTLASIDEDGDNQIYTIVSQTESGAFAINGSNLVTGTVFDYETLPNTYEVVIMVTDDSSESLTSTGTLTVNIADINDEDPVFHPNIYSFSIKEQTGVHTSFLQVMATDPDHGDTITYSIEGSGLFDIDTASGHISTTGELSYSAAPSYSLTVAATDNVSHNVTASVQINVTEETSPQFIVPPESVGNTTELPENITVGTAIITIYATDADGDTLTYHLTSETTEFSLNSSTRVVTVAQALDFDTQSNVYMLTFEARDENSATSTATLTASVTDVNDNAPVFSESSYMVAVMEGIPGSTQIIQINATDDDSSLDNYNSIQFSIQSGNTENKFTIDATSGQISATTLDYDILNNYNLVISAKDLNGALGFLETTVNVVVNVLGDCGVPVQEGYAFSNIDKTSYQGTADVACDTGYEGSVNPTTITCQANKMWTTASECVRKVVESSCTAGGNDCSLIPYSECGNGNKCLCKTGYRGSNGDQSCTAAVGASCSAIGNECSTITNGECGTGSKCVCKASYIGSIGDANCAAAIGTTCTTNGNECATVTHGECGPDDTCACITGYIGTTGELTCTAAVGSICIPGGSECNNVSNSECGSDNKCSCKYGFAGNIGDENCVTITCGGPPTVAYALVSLSKNGNDVTATYICLTGYQPTQDSTTTKTCTPPTSTWSNDDVQCEIKGSCPADPPAVNFATISLSDDGNTATYTCDIGHKLQDISVYSVACNQVSTEWNNPAAVCEDKDCGPPITLAPQNGHVSLNVEGVTTFGAVATITCDNGYDISGGLATLTCQPTEEWTQHSTICSIKDCGKTLPQPTNGATVLDDSEVSTYNATATQSCNDGYTPSGATQLICRATGQWAQITLNCNIKDCGKSYAPQYGRVNTMTSTSSSQYGDFANFTCEGGFQLNGLSHRECQSNGAWSGTADPTCDIKSICRTPTVVSRATYVLNNAGTEATYTCYDGYQLANTNQNILTCTTQDTVWSGTSPACKLKDDRKRLTSTLSLDIKMDSINLSDSRIKYDFMTKTENSIKGYFIINDISSFHVTGIRTGSLFVDFEVVLPNNAITQFIDAVTTLLASNDTIEIDGLSGEVQSIQADDVTYAANNVDSYRCAAFEILQGPCASGYECVVADGEAVCRVRKESDNFALIIGVGVGVPLGLLTVVFVVAVGIYVTRRSQRNDRSSDSDSSEEERRHFPNRIAKRYTGGYGQSSSAFYVPHHFEILTDSPLPSRPPPVTAEPPLDSNFSWDFLYNQYPPGKKFEIRRPKY